MPLLSLKPHEILIHVYFMNSPSPSNRTIFFCTTYLPYYNLVALMLPSTLSNSFHPCLGAPLIRHILHPSYFFCSYIRLLKLIINIYLPSNSSTHADDHHHPLRNRLIQPHANLCPPYQVPSPLFPPPRTSTAATLLHLRPLCHLRVPLHRTC